MIRTCLKRRLSNDKNDVFWMEFDFRILGDSPGMRRAFSRGMEASLTVQMGTLYVQQLALTCKEPLARSLPRANRTESRLLAQGSNPRRVEEVDLFWTGPTSAMQGRLVPYHH